MKTNRQWLYEMDDRTLAEFLTCGIYARLINYHTDPFYVNINDIGRQYTKSSIGVELWLSEPQQYEIVKGGAE